MEGTTGLPQLRLHLLDVRGPEVRGAAFSQRRAQGLHVEGQHGLERDALVLGAPGAQLGDLSAIRVRLINAYGHNSPLHHLRDCEALQEAQQVLHVSPPGP